MNPRRAEAVKNRREYEEQKKRDIEDCKTCDKRHQGVCWEEDPSAKPDWVKQKEEWYRDRNKVFHYV